MKLKFQLHIFSLKQEYAASRRDIVSYFSPIQLLMIVQLQGQRRFSKLHKQQLGSKPHWLPVEMKCHINICVFIYLRLSTTHTQTSLVSYPYCVGREWENSSWELILLSSCKKGGSVDCSWGALTACAEQQNSALQRDLHILLL